MLSFFDFFLLLFSLSSTLAIIVPLTGVLVRFRANYNPKGLQLDAEGGATPYTGPVVKTYFGMFQRVYQIEGVNGLYKGVMPTLLSTSVVTLTLLFVMDSRPTHGTYHAPNAGIFGTLFYSIFMMLIALPTAIITYRAITTPHKLPYFNPTKSLRALLTATERRRPWIIFLTPGLLAAEVSHIALVVLVLTPLRRLLLPALPADNSLPEISTFKIVIYVLVVAAFTVVLTPLEVVATRLAIQRNHSPADYDNLSQDPDGTDGDDFAGAEEDVIGLRNEEDPYLGLVDCIQRVVQEEGWQALYRAWWLTFLGTLGSGLSY
ncbi:hypothetical protein CYLTODRAFT_434448 [Cylindrobasidium torrendii FP15055 ss-10]|uniref:Mitochondrial carrier n=1 Tax=Cylindrobasidium torrendii FP15055 ss-10 TaxID=1314674 RepID=A0A0D7BS68_9AGAR|nr:hypothetical protein CYLTODRAFT_434448 [Cylindrobasidium torrendii FP15055 ss-10]